ncbi:MAG TPA: hypothetical protein VFW96_00325 [Thermomicrobiales bacterium]|nr:hypothetical protein [Thermomicrobiales bacterium]
MSEPETAALRFGLIGLGPRGQALAAAVNERPGVLLAAGAAVDDEGEGRGTWWGYATPDEVIAARDLDAIVVAAENRGLAIDYARRALERGKAALSLAWPDDLAQFDALVALAARAGVAYSQPNPLRYLPATRALRDAVAAGETGPLLSVFAAWRTRRAPGDDLLHDFGLPLFDYLRWCLDDEIVHAQVMATPLFGPERPVALLTLRTGKGVVLSVELAAVLPPGYQQEDELLIEALGEAAVLRAAPFNQAVTVVAATGRSRVPWHRDGADLLVGEFVAALREGAEPPGSPATVRPALALLDALRAAGTA